MALAEWLPSEPSDPSSVPQEQTNIAKKAVAAALVFIAIRI